MKDIIHVNGNAINTTYPKLMSFLDNAFALGDNKKLFQDIEISIQDIKQTVLESILLHDVEFSFEGILSCKINGNSTCIEVELMDIEDTTFISHILFTGITKSATGKNFFFPAERAAINMFNKELSIRRNNTLDDLLELENRTRKHNTQKEKALTLIRKTLHQNKRYTLPIRNSLAFADDIEFISKQEGQLAYLATQIETDLLKGHLMVDKESRIWFAGNNAKTKKVPLDMTASSTKVLAGLVLYLRYQAAKGMTIFIDEPELNLHPTMQVQMARILVRIMNAGVKLFVSTHSDYIVREINNMILAKESGDTEHYEESIYLDRNAIDVIRLFYPDHKSRQAQFERISIEQDGFAIKTIDDVIVDQNNTNDFLYNLLNNTNE